MSKKVGVNSLHKKFWKYYFSPYIRRKAALKLHERTGGATDADYAMCCTCGFVQHWKKMDAGHFISRGHKIFLYDERNVHAQCKRCNGFKQGNYADYRKFMIERYGEDVVEEMEARKNEIKQFKRCELEEMIEIYKRKLEDLKG